MCEGRPVDPQVDDEMWIFSQPPSFNPQKHGQLWLSSRPWSSTHPQNVLLVKLLTGHCENSAFCVVHIIKVSDGIWNHGMYNSLSLYDVIWKRMLLMKYSHNVLQIMCQNCLLFHICDLHFAGDHAQGKPRSLFYYCNVTRFICG